MYAVAAWLRGWCVVCVAAAVDGTEGAYSGCGARCDQQGSSRPAGDSGSAEQRAPGRDAEVCVRVYVRLRLCGVCVGSVTCAVRVCLVLATLRYLLSCACCLLPAPLMLLECTPLLM
jgi:hypothetical protein